MQTARIKFNEIYAANYGNEVIAFRPTAIITTTRSDGSSNVIQGHNILKTDEAGIPIPITLDPKKIIMPLEEHEELKKKKAETEAIAEAKRAAEQALKVKAVRTLAAVIGAVPVIEREDRPKERGVPQVEAGYYELKVNREAFEKLIAVIEPLLPKTS